MKNLRNITIQVIIILAISTLIAILFLPLANTDWAEGVRTSIGAEDNETGFGGEIGRSEPELSAAAGWIVSFVKIGLFMTIPGLITLGIRRLVKGKPKSRSATPA